MNDYHRCPDITNATVQTQCRRQLQNYAYAIPVIFAGASMVTPQSVRHNMHDTQCGNNAASTHTIQVASVEYLDQVMCTVHHERESSEGVCHNQNKTR